MANPLNNSFETWTVPGSAGSSSGVCTNWTVVTVNGGTATRSEAGSARVYSGTYAVNCRGARSGNPNQIGGLISDAFTVENDYITFWKYDQNAGGVTPIVKIFSSADVELMSFTLTKYVGWRQYCIYIGDLIDDDIKIQVQQSPTGSAGYYTIYDLVECTDTPVGEACYDSTNEDEITPDTATADSVHSTDVATNVIDDNDTTRWNQDTGVARANAWVKVDLGSVQSVGRVLIRRNTDKTATFNVDVSDDDSNWDNIVTADELTEVQEYYNIDASIRYVKISNFGGTQTYAQIFEIRSFEPAEITESISVEESVYLGEESDVNIPKLILAINESLYLGEESSVVFDKLSIDINESLYLGENIDVNIPKLILAINESLYLGENIDVNLSKLILNINESVYLGESSDAHLNEQVEYGVRIISYNPLIILSGINTVKLTHIDISTPAVPVVTTHVVSGITNAKDVVLNDSNDYFYLAGADGIVVKIEKADLDAQTIVDTSDTDDFQKISSLETFFRTFASTDDSSGEIIMIDEATISKINTDVRWSKRITNTISCLVNTILGKKINCDVRFSENVESVLKTDIRWLKYEYADLTQHPVDFNDIQVKINGTDLAPLNDVDLKSINITHTKGEYSTASFSLNRRHDNPNYDNQGNSSQITNQNAVLIYIDGHLEFSGTIQSFNAESELESIVVNARMTEPSRNKQTRSIPLASVGESLNLYHCLLNSVYVENPDLNTQAVITNENGLYWSGNEWVGDLNEAQVFASHALAESSIPSDYTSQQAWPTNYEESPAYYKGIQVNLGTSITQNIERYSSFTDSAALATKIEEGTFNPKQNWSYFWFASFENFISNVITTSSRYLGTSLGSLSADTWKINGASYKRQKQLDDDTADLGNYYVGSAPFQIISLQNGKLTTKDKWVDKSDGLYREKDASYDYIQYAKDAAALEYSKLKTINNSIIPVTSSQIDLTIDGYYYYAIKLLTRLNLSNTTASGIYFGSNGFPVSVKSISIDTNSMRVSIECDNQLSVEEIGEIDRNYPDVNSDEYINDKESVLNYRKYDPNVSGYIT